VHRKKLFALPLAAICCGALAAPAVAAPAKSTLNIALRIDPAGQFHGTIVSQSENCVKGRRVNLYRTSSGTRTRGSGDRKVAYNITKPLGDPPSKAKYQWDIKAYRGGWYYAKAPATDACAQSISRKTIHYRRDLTPTGG
jgi:hypothetical protein